MTDGGGDEEGGEGAGHDPEEEVAVADGFLDVAGDHAGEHHAEGHEGGADGVVGGLVGTVGEVDEEEHVGGEAEAVAELFDEDAGIDEEEAGRGGVAEEDIDGIGHRDGEDHGPEPVAEALTGDGDAAEDAAQGETNDAGGALGKANLGGGHGESAFANGIDQEGDAHLGQLGLGQAVEEHEEEGREDAFLGKEGAEGEEEFADKGAGGDMDGGMIGCGTGQEVLVVEPDGDEEAREDEEGDAPGVGDAAGMRLEIAR